MDPVTLAWSVAGIAGALALGLLMRVSGERRRTIALRSDLAEARKEVRGARKHDEQRTKALRRSEAEVERIGRQVGKAQKHAVSARDAARSERTQNEERIRELEQAAQQSSEEVTRLMGELDAVGETSGAALQRAEQAEAELATLTRSEKREEKEEEPESVEAKPADEALIAELTRRAEEAEAALAQRQAALEQASREGKRLAERIRTKETLYVSMRGELAIKKDQLKQQREELERLRAYRVALAEPEAPVEVESGSATAESPSRPEPPPALDPGDQLPD